MLNSAEPSQAMLKRLALIPRKLKASFALQTIESKGSDHPWIIGSNEPSTQPFARYQDGRFALMGCGVFRPIEMAMHMIDRSVYTFSDDKYGYKNIPKLFVLDLSSHVEEAWRRLKNLVCNTNGLSDFKKRLQEDSFYEGINSKGDYENLLDRLEDFCTSSNDFILLKHIVQKATFIKADWRNKKAMDFVAAQTQALPLVVYASNIPEIILNYDKKDLTKFEVFMRQLLSTKPDFTIYALTTAQFRNLNNYFVPDLIVTQEGDDLAQHLKALSAEGESYLGQMLKGPIATNKPLLTSFENHVNNDKEHPQHHTTPACEADTAVRGIAASKSIK